MEPFRASPLLSRREGCGRRSRRSLLLLSLALHALLPIGLLALPAGIRKTDRAPEPVRIVFYSPAEEEPGPPPPLEIVVPDPAPEPKPEPRPESPPPTALPEPPPAPPPAPSRPPSAPPPREIESSGKAHVATREPDPVERPVARLAGFGAEPEPARAPSGKTEARVVATARFDGGDVAVPRPGKSPPRGAVTSAGFAGDRPATGSGPSKARGSVQRGRFGDVTVPVAEPRARRRPAEEFDTPVEIVTKPRPDYTQEARKLRIEGDVVLEVTFVATGRLRVLRVVGGLGHGLDEEAVKAAEKIRFKPALRDGQPVDHTAKLRVIFRLA